MGELSVWHWLIVIGVFVLLFGARKLPEAARGLGRSARILKAELRAEDTTPAPTPSPSEPPGAGTTGSAAAPTAPSTAPTPTVSAEPAPPGDTTRPNGT
jgi:sec-independent protein translocase protein TatA